MAMAAATSATPEVFRN